MMENFKQEFKIYCETVENIKGLEILKQNLFDNVLNLEVFIDDLRIFFYRRIRIFRAFVLDSVHFFHRIVHFRKDTRVARF